MRINETIVRGLESVGVDAAFGSAGESVARRIIALRHSGKIKAIVTRNEQAASFAACFYAVFAPKLGICWRTTFPDAFNLLSGLALAMSRLLAISGYTSLAERSPASSRC